MRNRDRPRPVLLNRDRDKRRCVWSISESARVESLADSFREGIDDFDYARGEDVWERPGVEREWGRALVIVGSGRLGNTVLVGNGRTYSVAVLEQSDRIEGILD